MAHPYLRWLKIHRYEGFEGVEIEFSPEENLILGVNGAGKTQLLRLIGAILGDELHRLEADFSVEYELALTAPAHQALRCAAEGTAGSARLESSGVVSEEGTFRFRLEVSGKMSFQAEIAGAHLSIVDTSSPPRTFAWTRSGFLIGGIRSALASSKDPREQALPILSRRYVHEDDRDFRFFTREISFSVQRHQRSLQTSAAEAATWLFSMGTLVLMAIDPRSSGFLDGITLGLKQPQPRYRFTSEVLAVLLAPLRASDILLRPRPVDENEEEEKIVCKGIRVRVDFCSGAKVPDEALTFGQRRYLIAGLLAIAGGDAPFLIDELDNGLHPRLVEALMLLLQGRQRFFASHNKLVIDYTAFESPDDVQKKVHIVRRDDEGRQHVERISDAEAKEIFESIEVGIMHPADVLMTEGLW